jgi:hypothetical protein
MSFNEVLIKKDELESELDYLNKIASNNINKISTIIIFIDDENISNIIKKKIILEDNKTIKNFLNKALEDHRDYNIKYFLNYTLKEDMDYLVNNYLQNDYDLDVIKNLKNINEDIDKFNETKDYFKSTNSLIFILYKKEKLYYIKKEKEKNNKTKKIYNLKLK